MHTKGLFGRLRLLAAALIALGALTIVSSARADEFTITPESFTTVPSTFQAGAHPDVVTTIKINTEPNGFPIGGTPRNLMVNLPKGLVGAPSAAPTCPMRNVIDFQIPCPLNTAVGEVDATLYLGIPFTLHELVFNVNPYPDEPAALGFNAVFPVRIDTGVRTDGDYGITTASLNTTEAASLVGLKLTIWAVPADHNGPGPLVDQNTQRPYGGPSGEPRRVFWTNPTQCTAAPSLTSSARAEIWQSKTAFASANYGLASFTGCEELEFEPHVKARPTTNAADAPSGLNVDVEIPQNPDPDGLASSELRNAEVTLPEGLVVNPSSANGLGACSPDQIGMTSTVGSGEGHFDKSPANCPDAARLGNVEIQTPLLVDPLKGSIYLASPHQNPFGSLLGLYLVVEGQGLVIKLAGKVSADPQTGRLTATFDENPQLPFEHLRLAFDAGAFAPLRTPATCGRYSTTSRLTPWAAPEIPSTTPSDTYEISQGPNGSACGAAPNAPTFEAGSTAPLAGAYQPFIVNLRREDGSQQFSAVTLTPPAGLVAKLAGTPTCSDAALAVAAAKAGAEEKADPSCPAASQIGTVYAAAGAGPAPYNAPGKVYLTGPYKGAPLSLAIVTPATAGPFDLGTIVVRAALHLDLKTAQITATSDPIPTILQGIPLDIRSVSIRLDKPGFTLNPTSCDPTSVGGSLLTTTGAIAQLSNRFQLAECGRLKFKPSLKLSLKGGTTRAKYPALTAVLKPRPGDANLAGLSVALPHSEFLEQAHIRTVCTRVQFAAEQCPAASIYGKATVVTPLLDYPLTGPVYLRSSDNTLPDLVPDLHGPANQPIRIETDGRVDSIHGGIRDTFSFVPDVPFSKFTLELPGGKKSLLVNSRNICAGTNSAEVNASAHNGLTYSAQVPIEANCGGKSKKKKKGKADKHRSSHGHG
jgi:hypothetical protein